ncbi:MAG: mechanosensitive ion channel [Proteobacteria bacterium]|nr:mechanosensitive ion channel [Pseudomonadota bacterium]
MFFLGFMLIGRLWIHGLQPILTFLGIVTAALVITQKEAILNATGFVFILWRDLFAIGDRIQIDTHKGDVIGISYED